MQDCVLIHHLGRQRDLRFGKAGNFVTIFSCEIDLGDVYRLYATRCEIENFFDTAKNVLSVDRMSWTCTSR